MRSLFSGVTSTPAVLSCERRWKSVVSPQLWALQIDSSAESSWISAEDLLPGTCKSAGADTAWAPHVAESWDELPFVQVVGMRSLC